MGTRTRTISTYVANTFANATNVQTLRPTSDVTFANTTITGTANIATWNAGSIAMGNVIANTTGLFPVSNTASVSFGASTLRWTLYANTGNFTGTVTTSGGLFPQSNTIGASLGTSTQLWNLYANAINLGAASSFLPTSNAATGSIGSSTALWNMHANTITTYNSVNPFSNTVGFTLGSATARWVMNANSVTTTGGVYPSSNTVGTALGTATQRWVLNANTVTATGGVYPSSNTVGTALGTTAQRWVLNANTGNFSANVTTTGTVWSNTTITVKSTASISTGAVTFDLATAALFEVSLTENITSITINNVQSSGYVSHFVLSLVADGTARSVTWPASFKWAASQAPTLTATLNKKDLFVFFTFDGGTTWQASTVAQNT